MAEFLPFFSLNSEYLGRELNLRLTVNISELCLITRDYGITFLQCAWET